MAAVPRHYCPARKPDYVQAFKQAPPIWHRRLAATDGLEGIASVLASLVEHHQKSHHLGWLPCHYSTTWHTQWCPGFHRHHHPATETGHSRCGTTHPCRLVTCSDTPPPAAATRWACRELAVSHWHTTKHGLVPLHNFHHPLAWEGHLQLSEQSVACPQTAPSWHTQCTTFSESPIHWDGTWSLKKKKKRGESRGVSTTWTHLEHCARPSQSTKFWALQNKLVYTASEYTTAFTELKQEKKKKHTKNKAYATTSDAILDVTLLCEAKKNLQNLILTKERKVLVINTILTEWGLFKFTPKIRCSRALGEKKSPRTIKNKRVLEAMGDLPCFFDTVLN